MNSKEELETGLAKTKAIVIELLTLVKMELNDHQLDFYNKNAYAYLLGKIKAYEVLLKVEQNQVFNILDHI